MHFNFCHIFWLIIRVQGDIRCLFTKTQVYSTVDSTCNDIQNEFPLGFSYQPLSFHLTVVNFLRLKILNSSFVRFLYLKFSFEYLYLRHCAFPLLSRGSLISMFSTVCQRKRYKKTMKTPFRLEKSSQTVFKFLLIYC